MIDTSSIAAIQASLAGQAAAPASRSMAQRPEGHAASFAGELQNAITRVDERISASGALTERMLRGDDVELHTVALRAQEAQMSFDLFLQIRNRLIQGYQEIMRMQV